MNVRAHIEHIIQQRIADPLVSTTPNIDVLVPLLVVERLVGLIEDCGLRVAYPEFDAAIAALDAAIDPQLPAEMM